MTTIGRRIEIGALIALCFFLPLYEAPKSIALLVYVVAWLVNRVRTRDFGGRWDLWDTLIAAWLASGLTAAAFAGLHGSEWRGLVDLLRYATLLWLLKRSGYTGAEIRAVLMALAASTLVGLALGHWALWTGQRRTLELNSVGHVNHTAIYLAIVLGACAGWMFAGWRIVATGVTVLVLASLLVTASRGAIAVGLGMLLVLGAAWWPRSRAPLAAAAAVVAFTTALAFLGGAEVVRKHQANVQADNMMSYRGGIWRTALAGWERFPVFGVGMDNFKLITPDKLKAWRLEAGKDYDAKQYIEYPHAHSLFLNTLAERGVVGAAVLIVVLIAWAVFLVRYRPVPGNADDDWVLWAGAASAWMVTVGVGIVNTTLHDEHGVLAALLLGMWLSRLRSAYFER
jgi:O-antigen ligase